MAIEDKEKFDLIINMVQKVVNSDNLSQDGGILFEQVVELASEEGGLPSGPNIEYEVYYDSAIGRPPDGRLYPGQSVKIQDGTSFNVTFTDKS